MSKNGSGKSRFPLDLLEADYVIRRLKFRELSVKYNISEAMLTYHSNRRGWLKKREEFFCKTLEATQEAESKKVAKQDILSRSERIKIIKETISELRNEIPGAKTKSKETLSNAVVEASKHIEVLEGRFSDRVELKEEEKQKRLRQFQDRLNLVNSEN